MKAEGAKNMRKKRTGRTRTAQNKLFVLALASVLFFVGAMAKVSFRILQWDLSTYFKSWLAEGAGTGYLLLRAGLPACCELEGSLAEQSSLERGWSSLLDVLETDWTDPLHILASELPSLRHVPNVPPQYDNDGQSTPEPAAMEEEETLAALGPLRLPEPVPQVQELLPPSRVPEPVVTLQGPLVALYHTHASELYHRPGMNLEFDSYHLANSTDTGIIQVGQHLAASLESLGVPTIHSLVLHDTPSFTRAYQESAKTVTELVREYPTLQMIFDIHRDGAKGAQYITNIDGQPTAQILIVVTTDDYLPNPNWRENYAFATELKREMDQLYPGLCRGIMVVRDSRFNQHLHPQLLLLEIGNYNHTIEPALRSAELLANVIAKLVKEKKLR